MKTLSKICLTVWIVILAVLYSQLAFAGYQPRAGRSDSQLEIWYEGSPVVYDDSKVERYLLDDGKDLTSRQEVSPAPSFFDGGQGGQMLRVGDTVYVVERATGGGGQSDKFAGFYIPDQTWTQLPNLPEIITGQGAIGNVGDTIVVTMAADGQVDKETLLYNIETQNWQIGAPMPTELITDNFSDGGMNGRMPRFGDTLYYAGGFEVAGHADAAIAYNAPEDTWIRLADMPDSSDLGSMSSVVEYGADTHYIFMQSGEIPRNGDNDQLYRYHIEDDSWVQLDDIPTEMDGEGGHWLPGVHGGSNQFMVWVNASSNGIAGKMAAYNHYTGAWTIHSNDPADLTMNQISLVLLDKKVYGDPATPTINFTAMVSTNQLYYDGYKILHFSFIDGEE